MTNDKKSALEQLRAFLSNSSVFSRLTAEDMAAILLELAEHVEALEAKQERRVGMSTEGARYIAEQLTSDARTIELPDGEAFDALVKELSKDARFEGDANKFRYGDTTFIRAKKETK